MLDQSRDVSLVGGGEITVLPQGIDVEAMRTGGMYETQLNPPPGAPSARHRERNEMS